MQNSNQENRTLNSEVIDNNSVDGSLLDANIQCLGSWDICNSRRYKNFKSFY